ncbi:Flavin-dependent oxidoreductase, luciferase family (includes alkanesulfonate monooxygenase SsuD and methylene tetrahydromethanopterin reductase) [Halogranum gelatinilyticum]|uniref:Flavin-dependent oxidoreductase, luciferase family (Includes alkanesulfonate monooxygenase SsuD and methylene tetrahydromethanopterin reductase) n=1 Tax=Halogranum gelatinilyticum TaxID=660521 RepID=A0A1G9U6X2_9EURY|nr:LLM class flavin-dependent oxidoreductase [Halogranum gelatinilyticum]SDM55720.1 Flavin-dependent oxidoreductase, luciferase family (includes alkanesulfonate monooxygenase SsuD and methylene tetrahydromethanopterin reductase) [Halogranum gelatinilyticum]
MTHGVLLPGVTDVVDPDFARELESLGYGRVWTGELWGTDAFLSLSHVAHHTDDIDLGTAIVNVFSRSPATLAAAAATLNATTGRDVVLGVGASTPKAVEDLHGVDYDRPVRRIHETVELVKAYTSKSDERVDYDGELFDVADFPPLDADIPVYVAALGPASRRATGRVADGWLPHNVPFPRLAEAFEVVADAAREAGRDPDDIAVAPYVPSAVSDDADEARRAVKGHLAYYVGSGEGYRKAVAQSFPDAAEAVAEAWRAGDREDARAAVTDEMVDALGVAGTPEDAREQFRAVAALDAVDDPIVVVPAQADEAMTMRTVRELSPERA